MDLGKNKGSKFNYAFTNGFLLVHFGDMVWIWLLLLYGLALPGKNETRIFWYAFFIRKVPYWFTNRARYQCEISRYFHLYFFLAGINCLYSYQYTRLEKQEAGLHFWQIGDNLKARENLNKAIEIYKECIIPQSLTNPCPRSSKLRHLWVLPIQPSLDILVISQLWDDLRYWQDIFNLTLLISTTTCWPIESAQSN